MNRPLSHRVWAPACAGVTSLLLVGCMVGPDYRRPEQALPAAFVEPASSATPAIDPRWWSLYRDPVLDDLVRTGLERNADIRLAVARVEEAEAALREARATVFFPLVQGNAGASRARTIANGTENNFTLGLSTSFELDLWGRLRRAERAVQEQLLASRYGRDTVRLTLAATIARTYFAARSLDSQLAASEEILRAANESLSLARKRSDAGLTSALDVYQAASLQSAAAAQAKEIARQRAAILHQLGVLGGRLDLRLEAKDIASLPVPPLPPAGLPSQLLERRPDVRQAEAQLAAATERIGIARAAQLPTLSLTGSFGAQSSELDSLLKPGALVWSIGGNLLGPILDGGRYRARSAQAEAQARQAEAIYQRAVETAFRDVSDALSNVRLAADSETDLVARLDAARNALRLAQRRYELGYSAYLEVLDAQRTLNDAQLAFIRNRQAYLSYTVDLMNSLGGGWSS
ncbi:MAG TPA: efflux transporter outer membrane subunit [Usitatibacter sp.]|nr:efflux transporter outer membrane subunit [Usitatibacter sp.]